MDSSQLKLIGSGLETTLSSYEKVLRELQAAEPPKPERKSVFEVATIQAVMRRLSEQGVDGFDIT